MFDKGKTPSNISGLTFARDFFSHSAKRSAHQDLLCAVFDIETMSRGDHQSPTWQPFAHFDAAGRCVASAEACELSLVADGVRHKAGGIRLVAVAEDWRGRGLFRDLMECVVAWGMEREIGLLLLYAAEPELYRRFGFAGVAQHAFVGEAPDAAAGALARRLDLGAAEDRAVFERLLAARMPVSGEIAVVDAPTLVLEKLTSDDSLVASYLPDLDAAVVHEIDADTLVLVDIVAAAIPSLSRIRGALACETPRVKTLFPPDLLEWHAQPIAEDTGLMARGDLPLAMRRPFMLPPTTEF